MSTDDLKAHAASDQDFYALLDISPASTESEIRRAYRRTALKYHPDKISNPTQADIDKFHNLQIANDVLSDPDLKQLYDNTREARLRKQRERDQLDAARRAMVDDLERREREGAQRGVKRPFDTGTDEAKMAAEMERCAADGRRRRREAAEKMQRERDEEVKAAELAEEEARKAADRSGQKVDRSQEKNYDELERSVKVLFRREDGKDTGVEWLKGLFGRFGKIQGTFMLKDKRKRVEGEKDKVTFGTGVVVYESIVSAHAAVLDGETMIQKARQGQLQDWAAIESVNWASGKGPDLGSTSAPAPDAPPATTDTSKDAAADKPTAPPKFSFMSNSAPKSATGKAPSFGSFNPGAASGGPKPADTSNNFMFQEQVRMRMRAAQREKERKALEEELAREDEAADANA